MTQPFCTLELPTEIRPAIPISQARLRLHGSQLRSASTVEFAGSTTRSSYDATNLVRTVSILVACVSRE